MAGQDKELSLKIKAVLDTSVVDKKILELNKKILDAKKSGDSKVKKDLQLEKQGLQLKKQELKLTEAGYKQAAKHREQEKRHMAAVKQNADRFRWKGGGSAGYEGGKQVTSRGSLGALKAVGGAAGAAVGSILGFMMSGITSGYQKYVQYQQAMGANIGGTKGGIGMQNIGMYNRAKGLGFGPTQAAGQSTAMLRATGVVGPRELQQGMRSTGMDEGGIASIFNTLAQAGFDFKGNGGEAGPMGANSQGGKEFSKMIAAGTASGLMKGRFPEYLQGVQQIMQQQGGVLSGNVNSSSITGLLTALGQTGLSGFLGARGGQLAGSLNDLITNPQGQGGQMLVRQAMGFGKPGGGTGYYQAERMREEGLNDPENLKKVLSELNKQYAPQERELALRDMSGGKISLHQGEDLFKMFKSGGLNPSSMKKVMDEGASLQDKAYQAMLGSDGTLQHIEELEEKGLEAGRMFSKDFQDFENLQQDIFEKLLPIMKAMADDIRAIYNWLKEHNPVKKLSDFGESIVDPIINEQQFQDLMAFNSKSSKLTGASSLRDLMSQTNHLTVDESVASRGGMLGGQISSASNRDMAARLTAAAYAKGRAKYGISVDRPMLPEELAGLKRSMDFGSKLKPGANVSNALASNGMGDLTPEVQAAYVKIQVDVTTDGNPRPQDSKMVKTSRK